MSEKKFRRLDPAVNAGSMADIAFLLLIFFLVTTTIVNDKGIRVALPPIANTPPKPINQDNVLTVKVNASNQLLVEGQMTQVEDLRAFTKEFIMNPQEREDRPSKPTAAIVSLQNDRSTSYDTYINVYNELRAAYNELWEEQAQQIYNASYKSLSKAQQKSVRAIIPLVISEAEPSDYAGL